MWLKTGTNEQFTKEKKDERYHQLFLAKNAEGYKNLIKLCSLGYMEGLYSKWPRIDKELILKYHEGLIATTCCIGASVPQTILKKVKMQPRKNLNGGLIFLVKIIISNCNGMIFLNKIKVNEVL